MEIEHIKFQLDSGISIQCRKSGEADNRQFTPKQLRSAIVSYEISLKNDPLKQVKEKCRITNRNIEYTTHHFTLFFPLENILEPHESQITFRSLIFVFANKTKTKFPLNETYSFTELHKNNSTHSTIGRNQGQTDESLQRGKNAQSGSTPPPGILSTPSTITTTKEELQHLFEDSYHKFLRDFQNSQVNDMKTNQMEFNMKNFGISLLCKMLLLVKYFNELVDNDFQDDLHTFLQQNILDAKKLEGIV